HIAISEKDRKKEPEHPLIDADLIEIFNAASKEIFGIKRGIVVEYYPYTTLKNTIRRRDGVLYVRLSDVLRNAPNKVKEAIAAILLCKIKGIKPHPKHTDIYQKYTASEETKEVVYNIRQKRSMKIVTGPNGDYYDLEESFDRMNRTYFNGKLDRPVLTWSEKKTVRRFGHHDEAMNTVVISKTLDDETVPRFVLDYIMYHELLHIEHGTTYAKGRRRVHTRAFKQDEEKFERFIEAKRWLDRRSKSDIERRRDSIKREKETKVYTRPEDMNTLFGRDHGEAHVITGNEDEYSGLLSAIESAISGYYRENTALKDRDVIAALKNLRRDLTGKYSTARYPFEHRVQDNICMVLLAKSEYGMRRSKREVKACLNHVLSSVKRHHKIDGVRGYLDFIVEYI
ncbi:MAG: hypothetical protein V3U20_10915, partial [Thermoplasmata archaeon]